MSYINSFLGWKNLNENRLFEDGEPSQESEPQVRTPEDAKREDSGTLKLDGQDGSLTKNDINKIQTKLIELKYLDPNQQSGRSAADGMVGPKTKEALQKFRDANGIKETTIITQTTVGPETYKKLVEVFKPNAPKPNAPTPTPVENTTTTTTTAAPKTEVDQNPNAIIVQPGGQTPIVPPTGSPADISPADAAEANQKLAIEIAEALKNKFENDKAFWKPFKGLLNDNEKEAGEAFGNWCNSEIYPKIAKLPEADPNKKALETAMNEIIKKLKGGTAKDKYTFSLKVSSGGQLRDQTYTINTDF